MKKLLTLLCAVTLVLGLAITSSATPIFYEADNVSGVGTITYGWDTTTSQPTDVPPEFQFEGSTGNYYGDLTSFLPGEYTIDVTLTGFWVTSPNFTLLPYVNFTSGAYTFSSPPPLSGAIGQLSWIVTPATTTTPLTGWISYDFGTTGAFTNAGVNAQLAAIDLAYSNAANGIMDANIGWDTLRVELNSTAPVPEPSTLLLMGIGLLGLVSYSRKRSKKS